MTNKQLTEEDKRSIMAMMRKSMKKSAQEPIGNKELKGSVSESHINISSPELNKEDFQFNPPEGTVLKESLF